MAEAWNPSPLLNPTSLHTMAMIDEARELVEKMATTTDMDELADLIEHTVDKSERAHAVVFHLVLRVRGMPPPPSGVELVGGMG